MPHGAHSHAMSRFAQRVYAGTLSLILLTLASGASAFSFIPINVPGASRTLPYGINKAGQIVGSYDNSAGTHGFLRNTDGTFITIDVPGADGTIAYGINRAGQIAGTYFVAPGHHCFLRNTDGTFIAIDVPGAPATTAALGITKSGQIVGFYQEIVGGVARGFRRNTDGTFTTIDVPGAFVTLAYGISGKKIVGYYSDGTGTHGFLLKRGHYLPIDFPGAQDTYATGISRKAIVGFYVDPSNFVHGYLATP
jgi:hypothetical protein